MSGEIKRIKVDHLPLNINDGDVFEIAQSNPNYLTHSFFKYPCKFIPEIPHWAIQKYANHDSLIYDPFCGSGTTLLEANLFGCDAFGSEIDQFAKLLTRVKTSKPSKQQIEEMPKIFEQIIKSANQKETKSLVPSMNNIEHWFPMETIEKLGKASYKISCIKDELIKNFFRICLASIIKKVSYCDDVSPKPYVSNRIKKEPTSFDDAFIAIFDNYYKKEVELSNVDLIGKSSFTIGDATSCNCDAIFDLAFTSPPYVNAFDYGRTLRLEDLWLFLDTEETIRDKKKKYVGTEHISEKEYGRYLSVCDRSNTLKLVAQKIKDVDSKRATILLKFFNDMLNNLIDVRNHLKKSSIYGIVIVDSLIRNIEVPSAIILKELAETIGFKKELFFSYIIKNPYIRIPRGGRGGQIKYDNVLILRREDNGTGK